MNIVSHTEIKLRKIMLATYVININSNYENKSRPKC